MIQDSREPEKVTEPEMSVEPIGDAPLGNVTLEDVYKMFYVMLKQFQEANSQNGEFVKMGFPVELFNMLPKNLIVDFMQEGDHLFAWVPETPSQRKKRKKRKTRLYLPDKRLIVTN